MARHVRLANEIARLHQGLLSSDKRDVRTAFKELPELVRISGVPELLDEGAAVARVSWGELVSAAAEALLRLDRLTQPLVDSLAALVQKAEQRGPRLHDASVDVTRAMCALAHHALHACAEDVKMAPCVRVLLATVEGLLSQPAYYTSMAEGQLRDLVGGVHELFADARSLHARDDLAAPVDLARPLGVLRALVSCVPEMVDGRVASLVGQLGDVLLSARPAHAPSGAWRALLTLLERHGTGALVECVELGDSAELVGRADRLWELRDATQMVSALAFARWQLRARDVLCRAPSAELVQLGAKIASVSEAHATAAATLLPSGLQLFRLVTAERQHARARAYLRFVAHAASAAVPAPGVAADDEAERASKRPRRQPPGMPPPSGAWLLRGGCWHDLRARLAASADASAARGLALNRGRLQPLLLTAALLEAGPHPPPLEVAETGAAAVPVRASAWLLPLLCAHVSPVGEEASCVALVCIALLAHREVARRAACDSLADAEGAPSDLLESATSAAAAASGVPGSLGAAGMGATGGEDGDWEQAAVTLLQLPFSTTTGYNELRFDALRAVCCSPALAGERAAMRALTEAARWVMHAAAIGASGAGAMMTGGASAGPATAAAATSAGARPESVADATQAAVSATAAHAPHVDAQSVADSWLVVLHEVSLLLPAEAFHAAVLSRADLPLLFRWLIADAAVSTERVTALSVLRARKPGGPLSVRALRAARRSRVLCAARGVLLRLAGVSAPERLPRLPFAPLELEPLMPAWLGESRAGAGPSGGGSPRWRAAPALDGADSDGGLDDVDDMVVHLDGGETGLTVLERALRDAGGQRTQPAVRPDAAADACGDSNGSGTAHIILTAARVLRASVAPLLPFEGAVAEAVRRALEHCRSHAAVRNAGLPPPHLLHAVLLGAQLVAARCTTRAHSGAATPAAIELVRCVGTGIEQLCASVATSNPKADVGALEWIERALAPVACSAACAPLLVALTRGAAEAVLRRFDAVGLATAVESAGLGGLVGAGGAYGGARSTMRMASCAGSQEMDALDEEFATTSSVTAQLGGGGRAFAGRSGSPSRSVMTSSCAATASAAAAALGAGSGGSMLYAGGGSGGGGGDASAQLAALCSTVGRLLTLCAPLMRTGASGPMRLPSPVVGITELRSLRAALWTLAEGALAPADEGAGQRARVDEATSVGALHAHSVELLLPLFDALGAGGVSLRRCVRALRALRALCMRVPSAHAWTLALACSRRMCATSARASGGSAPSPVVSAAFVLLHSCIVWLKAEPPVGRGRAAERAHPAPARTERYGSARLRRELVVSISAVLGWCEPAYQGASEPPAPAAWLRPGATSPSEALVDLTLAEAGHRVASAGAIDKPAALGGGGGDDDDDGMGIALTAAEARDDDDDASADDGGDHLLLDQLDARSDDTRRTALVAALEPALMVLGDTSLAVRLTSVQQMACLRRLPERWALSMLFPAMQALANADAKSSARPLARRLSSALALAEASAHADRLQALLLFELSRFHRVRIPAALASSCLGARAPPAAAEVAYVVWRWVHSGWPLRELPPAVLGYGERGALFSAHRALVLVASLAAARPPPADATGAEASPPDETGAEARARAARDRLLEACAALGVRTSDVFAQRGDAAVPASALHVYACLLAPGGPAHEAEGVPSWPTVRAALRALGLVEPLDEAVLTHGLGALISAIFALVVDDGETSREDAEDGLALSRDEAMAAELQWRWPCRTRTQTRGALEALARGAGSKRTLASSAKALLQSAPAAAADVLLLLNARLHLGCAHQHDTTARRGAAASSAQTSGLDDGRHGAPPLTRAANVLAAVRLLLELLAESIVDSSATVQQALSLLMAIARAASAERGFAAARVGCRAARAVHRVLGLVAAAKRDAAASADTEGETVAHELAEAIATAHAHALGVFAARKGPAATHAANALAALADTGVSLSSTDSGLAAAEGAGEASGASGASPASPGLVPPPLGQLLVALADAWRREARRPAAAELRRLRLSAQAHNAAGAADAQRSAASPRDRRTRVEPSTGEASEAHAYVLRALLRACSSAHAVDAVGHDVRALASACLGELVRSPLGGAERGAPGVATLGGNAAFGTDEGEVELALLDGTIAGRLLLEPAPSAAVAGADAAAGADERPAGPSEELLLTYGIGAADDISADELGDDEGPTAARSTYGAGLAAAIELGGAEHGTGKALGVLVDASTRDALWRLRALVARPSAHDPLTALLAAHALRAALAEDSAQQTLLRPAVRAGATARLRAGGRSAPAAGAAAAAAQFGPGDRLLLSDLRSFAGSSHWRRMACPALERALALDADETAFPLHAPAAWDGSGRPVDAWVCELTHSLLCEAAAAGGALHHFRFVARRRPELARALLPAALACVLHADAPLSAPDAPATTFAELLARQLSRVFRAHASAPRGVLRTLLRALGCLWQMFLRAGPAAAVGVAAAGADAAAADRGRRRLSHAPPDAAGRNRDACAAAVHLLFARLDLCECAAAWLAVGAHSSALQQLELFAIRAQELQPATVATSSHATRLLLKAVASSAEPDGVFGTMHVTAAADDTSSWLATALARGEWTRALCMYDASLQDAQLCAAAAVHAAAREQAEPRDDAHLGADGDDALAAPGVLAAERAVERLRGHAADCLAELGCTFSAHELLLRGEHGAAALASLRPPLRERAFECAWRLAQWTSVAAPRGGGSGGVGGHGSGAWGQPGAGADASPLGSAAAASAAGGAHDPRGVHERLFVAMCALRAGDSRAEVRARLEECRQAVSSSLALSAVEGGGALSNDLCALQLVAEVEAVVELARPAVEAGLLAGAGCSPSPRRAGASAARRELAPRSGGACAAATATAAAADGGAPLLSDAAIVQLRHAWGRQQPTLARRDARWAESVVSVRASMLSLCGRSDALPELFTRASAAARASGHSQVAARYVAQLPPVQLSALAPSASGAGGGPDAARRRATPADLLEARMCWEHAAVQWHTRGAMARSAVRGAERLICRLSALCDDGRAGATPHAAGAGAGGSAPALALSLLLARALHSTGAWLRELQWREGSALRASHFGRAVSVLDAVTAAWPALRDSAALSCARRDAHYALAAHLDVLSRHADADDLGGDAPLVTPAERDAWMGEALRSHAASLREAGAGRHDASAVLRVASIWFRLRAGWASARAAPATDAALDRGAALELLGRIPTHKLLPAVPQIASRLGSSGGADGDADVRAVLERVASAHPHHALPALIALSNGDKLSSEERTMHFRADQGKLLGARRVLDALRARGARARSLIDEYVGMSNAYLQLAWANAKPLVEEAPRRRPPAPGHGPHKLDALPRLKPADASSAGGGTISELRLPMRHAAVLTAPLPPACGRAESLDDEPAGRRRAAGAAVAPEVVHMHKVGDTFITPGGINLPKVILVTGDDGRRYRQLVKGRDDLRQDAVMQQLFAHVNGMLSADRSARARRLALRTYRVVPLSPTAGVLEWVNGTITMGSWLGVAHRHWRPQDWESAECRKKMEEARAGKRAEGGLLATYRQVCEHFRPVMHRWALERWSHAAGWHEHRLAFTRSFATASMAGYVVGLGDRHPANILLDEHSAECVMIDLGIAFEQGKLLPTPERVPFRLTRDVVDGFGVCGVEGPFRLCAEATMRVLRAGAEPLLTVLEVLLHDPLFKWTLSPKLALRKQREAAAGGSGEGGAEAGDAPDAHAPGPDCESAELAAIDGGEATEPTSVDAEHALLVVRDKLNGRMAGSALAVDGQVRRLINQAMDDDNLAHMYSGWQAWV